MTIYIVFSNYFDSGVFGTYSSVKRARIAFEHFLAEDEDIVAFEDLGGYSYQFTTKNGETFSAEIDFDVLDAEFVEGVCKKD
jgi:hypothetical protein